MEEITLQEEHIKNKDKRLAFEVAFHLDLELFEIISETNVWRQSTKGARATEFKAALILN